MNKILTLAICLLLVTIPIALANPTLVKGIPKSASAVATFDSKFQVEKSTVDQLTLDMICRADVNNDGQVNGLDMAKIVNGANWGTSKPEFDLNGDGTVNRRDLLFIRAFWFADASHCI